MSGLELKHCKQFSRNGLLPCKIKRDSVLSDASCTVLIVARVGGELCLSEGTCV